MNTILRMRMLCTVLGSVLAGSMVWAQAPASAVAASGGHPDLSGYWVSQDRGPRGGPPGRGPPGRGGPPRGFGPGAAGPPGGPGGSGRPQPTAAGRAAAQGYEQPFDDPAIQCDIANIIFGWTHDQNVNEIRQAGNRITLRYGYMDFVRTIHLGLREHPRNLPPTRGGHSIGRWDGDTLVVDTVGLSAGVLIPISGVMFSSQAHVVERFTLDAGAKTLTRTYSFEDPLYLQQPHTGRDVMSASREPYTPYECVELSGDNNRRPAAK
jgi:hypothetical protein